MSETVPHPVLILDLTSRTKTIVQDEVVTFFDYSLDIRLTSFHGSLKNRVYLVLEIYKNETYDDCVGY